MISSAFYFADDSLFTFGSLTFADEMANDFLASVLNEFADVDTVFDVDDLHNQIQVFVKPTVPT